MIPPHLHNRTNHLLPTTPSVHRSTLPIPPQHSPVHNPSLTHAVLYIHVRLAMHLCFITLLTV